MRARRTFGSGTSAGSSADRNRLSREIGPGRKKWKGRLPVALLFPNVYAVGMSNLGFQLVHGLAGRHPDVVCERFFLPDGPGLPLSCESSRPLRDFPVILCSVSFEHDFLSLVGMLRAAGIPPLVEERAPTAPLVIAGGVATFINPEPLAPFVDLFVLGEAEPLLPPLISHLVANRGKNREELAEELAAGFPGCYAPQRYKPAYDGEGRLLGMTGPASLPARIRRVGAAGSAVAAHSEIVTPDAELASMFMVELGRGCSRGCRFCAAGFVYRSPRLWPAASIIAALDKKPAAARKVGLLGMEMARREDLETIAGHLLALSCSLSFSSLRADAITPTLLALLAASGLKSVAIAPDGGSERLRRVINKGLTERDLLIAAENLARIGIRTIKLYFMIGLPTETWDDLRELVALTLAIRSRLLAVGRTRGRMSTLVLSVNCFVPKAWTPFQWQPFEPVPLLLEKLAFLRKSLAGVGNIRIIADHPVHASFQAMLARGDRRVGRVLPALLDQPRRWAAICRQQGVKPADYSERQRERSEVFPWEIVDHGLKREYLWAESRRAGKGLATGPCEIATCKRCGVCK